MADARNIGYQHGAILDGGTMTYIHADVIWVRRSPTGDKELELLARHDGMFEFREATATVCEHNAGPELLMLPSYTSGLYPSRMEAEADASQTIIWLKDDGFDHDFG